MSLVDIYSSKVRAPLPVELQESNAAEFYQTPTWCIEDLLEYGPQEIRDVFDLSECSRPPVADPCAGHGRIPWAIKKRYPKTYFELHEMRESCRPWLDPLKGDLRIRDFLGSKSVTPSIGLAIFNSPFSLTLDFVKKAFFVYPWAIVASFQRQSWRGARPRAEWIAGHQPRIYTFGPHRRRPSFRADGKTDGCEYEWCVWAANERNEREIPGGHVLIPGPDEPPIQGRLDV